ncbi:MAG: hypothetical protein GSR86_02910 [Desulfurococcales archaeon]|nr:hypothetical protein [Desulfurococcales archaeon]
MAGRYYQCIVCGRKFPEGQGIVIEKSGRVMHFHSRRCAYRFLRLVLERADDSCIKPAIDEVLEEFRRILKERRVEKVI